MRGSRQTCDNAPSFPAQLRFLRGRFMKRFSGVLIISLFAVVSFAFAQERRFTIDDLLKVRRVGDPQVSPKGDLVAFTITDVDKAANKNTSQIYLVPVG